MNRDWKKSLQSLVDLAKICKDFLLFRDIIHIFVPLIYNLFQKMTVCSQ